MPSQWMGERRGKFGSRSTSQATPPSSSHWPACGATCSLPCGRWLVGHWVHLPLLSPLRPPCQPRAATLCSLVVRGRRPTTLLSLPVGADCWSGGIDGTRGTADGGALSCRLHLVSAMDMLLPPQLFPTRAARLGSICARLTSRKQAGRQPRAQRRALPQRPALATTVRAFR